MKLIVPEIYIKNCRKALDFYSELFNGEIKNLQMSQDLEMFNDYKDKVVHSELHISKHCIFYFVDIFDEKRSSIGNVTLVLHMHTKQELERVYKALKEDGQISMALQKTFFGEYHAILIDRFGAPWALNFAPKRQASI